MNDDESKEKYVPSPDNYFDREVRDIQVEITRYDERIKTFKKLWLQKRTWLTKN